MLEYFMLDRLWRGWSFGNWDFSLFGRTISKMVVLRYAIISKERIPRSYDGISMIEIGS